MKRRSDILPALAILIASVSPALAQAPCQEDSYGNVRCSDGSYGHDSGSGYTDVWGPEQDRDNSNPPAQCHRDLSGQFVCQ